MHSFDSSFARYRHTVVLPFLTSTATPFDKSTLDRSTSDQCNVYASFDTIKNLIANILKFYIYEPFEKIRISLFWKIQFVRSFVYYG